jgi:hypothetical protein
VDWAVFVDKLLPGLSTVLLAIISGAGGSALLELYYKPRRDRRRAAGLLLAEILLNTDLALLQAHARWKAPKKIPSDFSFSLMSWDAAAPLLSELPLDLLKRTVLLYNRYQACNQAVQSYSKTLDDRNALPKDAEDRRKQLEGFLKSTIDVFNTGLDHSIDDGKELLPKLLGLSGTKEKGDQEKAVKTYQQRVDEFLAERQEAHRSPPIVRRRSARWPSAKSTTISRCA